MNYDFLHALCLNFLPFLSPSSLIAMAERRILIMVHPPQIFLNLGFLLVLLLVAMWSTCQELLIFKAKTAMDQAGKSFGLMKHVSSLESQVYDLMAKVAHFEECDSFLVGIIESACEQLQCKFLEAPWCFWLHSCELTCLILLNSSGICLNPVDENRRVSERLEALERTYSDTNTFWIDPRRRSSIVLLQDRV
jgi:hypothetical protein